MAFCWYEKPKRAKKKHKKSKWKPSFKGWLFEKGESAYFEKQASEKDLHQEDTEYQNNSHNVAEFTKEGLLDYFLGVAHLRVIDKTAYQVQKWHLFINMHWSDQA